MVRTEYKTGQRKSEKGHEKEAKNKSRKEYAE
jgi:hypothetical protein